MLFPFSSRMKKNYFMAKPNAEHIRDQILLIAILILAFSLLVAGFYKQSKPKQKNNAQNARTTRAFVLSASEFRWGHLPKNCIGDTT